jgi:hypothetical protein
MPYAAPLNPDDQNDPNKNNPGGPVNISGQSTTVSTGIPGQEPSGGKQKGSGQYANIQSYLDANKSQGDQMGEKIAGEVSAKAEDATQRISAYEAKAPTVQAYDPNEAIGRATNLSDDEKTQYKNHKATGGYTGPTDVSGVQGYQEANRAGDEAVALVRNAGNETGQRELLKQTYSRPQYSAGENNLDQALVQGSSGSKAKLENLGQKYSGLNSYLNNANTTVGNAVNAAKTQALTNRQAFIPAEAQARQSLLNPIQQRAEQAWTDNQALAGRVSSDLSDDTLSDETLRILGLKDGQSVYDVNLGSYLTPDLTQVGVDNVATPAERSKYAALSALFDDPTMKQITADGKSINALNFNKENFDKDLQRQSGQYAKWQNARNNINADFDRQYAEGLQTVNQLDSPRGREIATQQLAGLVASQRAAALNAADVSFQIDSNKNNLNRKITKG